MLGDGELPSYEEPPCQECPPVPDYCSTGQTVLDPCGCCEECAKGENDECGELRGSRKLARCVHAHIRRVL